MKKFLSLVLALTLTLSLVTISAGAKDFTDDKNITYDEAVAVISEIGVVDGDTNGSFRPTDGLTRGAAAKIICNLILGPTTAAELHADTAPFPDVPLSNTFSGYIAYCAKEGIISGYADGTFKPAAPLTGYAFMKMLLGALGYDGAYEGYTGANWSVNVAKQAIGIGLNKGLVDEFNGVDFVTREEAALYAFNTLKATMVSYDNKITATVNGADVTISNTTAKPVTWSEGINNDGNIKKDGFVQFAEEFFPKLVRQDDSTKFMEPANTWVYDKTEIGTYERTDLLVETYTAGVTGKDAYDLLKSGVINDNNLEAYLDGVNNKAESDANKIGKDDLVRSNTTNLPGTGNGVVTKVYLDTDQGVITFVSINTYLAQATADYSESKEYAPLTVYYTDASGRNFNVDVEEVANVVNVKKDSYYQVNISKKDNANGEVVVLKDVEVLEDSTVTKFSATNEGSDKSSNKVTKLTTGGNEYKANVKAFYDKDVLSEYDKTLLTDATYNVYVDSNGYFIGVDLFQGTQNYVFITGFDRNSSNLSVKTATASAIFLDGTMKNIEVNVTNTDKNIEKLTASEHNEEYFIKWSTAGYSDLYDGGTVTSAWALAGKYGVNGIYDLNQWYTYTVDEGGTYTLKPATRMTWTKYPTGTAQTIRTDSLNVQDSQGNKTRVYGEDGTVFLTVGLDVVDTTAGAQKAITEVTGVYTGVQNVDIDVDVTDAQAVAEGQVYTVYDSDWYVIGAVVIGEARGSTANYAYIVSGAKSEELKDGTYYWEFDAVMGGEKVTLTAKSKYKSTIDALNKGSIQELRFDGDYVVSIKDISSDKIYNDFTKDMDGSKYSAYVMRDELTTSANDNPNTLMLQGRTLYVTSNRVDKGLALASDAKAVTIQKENGEADVVTNFSNVTSAIAHLADASAADGFQYNGKIFAALNSNGSAAWVVFVNDTPLTTGSSSTGSYGGTWYKATTQVYSTGYAVVNLNVTRPDYMTATTQLNYSFDILVNGQPYATVNDTTAVTGSVVDAGSRTDSYTWTNQASIWYAPIDANATVTVANFKFTNPTAQGYYVRYYNAATNELIYDGSKTGTAAFITNDFTGTPGTDVSNTVAVGGNTLTMKVNNSKYTAGTSLTWSVVNGYDNATKLALTNIADTISLGTTMTTGETVMAGKWDGTQQVAVEDFVKVYVDFSALTPDTSLKVTSTAVNGKALSTMGITDPTDGANTLTVTAPSSFVSGQNFDLKFKASAAITNDATVEEYVLYVTINGTEYKVGALSASDATLTMRNVTENLTIESARIVTIKKLAVDLSKSSWNDYSVTLVFNQNLDASSVVGQISAGTLANSNAIDQVVVSGNTITITMKNGTGALASGNTLTLTTSIKSSTLKADGTTQVAYAGDTTVNLAASNAITLS